GAGRVRLQRPCRAPGRGLPRLAALRGAGPCRWTDGMQSAGGVGAERALGPLRRALVRYRDFLSHPAAMIAGDLNSNTIWDKPGWRINHSTKVRLLEEKFGLVSAWHAVREEPHGQETVPTLYWRDRTKDGPTYHIDYV